MTVTYTSHVATCKGFGCFWKLLFRWKGSIYKLVWMELLAYSCIYYLCSLTYRFALNDDQKRLFEKISIFCQHFSDLIPLSFVLGFYVSIVVQRWWEQYMSLPWPDSLALFVSTSIHGQDERSRLMRRTVMRYVNLCQTLTLIMISPKVKKRFPTLDHLVEAGFMTSNELKIYKDLEEKTPHPKYWMPLVWAGSIVTRARKEGRIRDDFAVKTIIDEINRIRGLCGGLLNYDWISIPLVYTQVVTLAVYSFFIATLMGRQFLDPTQNIPNHHVDFYIPVFTFLQFFFFMGWLKVAESLVNPFGEDDDDFEVNWLVDRNLQVSYLIVDEMHNEHPELIQDIYWDEVFPQELPYTIAAEHFRRNPPQGSTANMEIPEPQQEFLPLVEEEDEGIHESMSGINTDLETGSTKAIDIKRTSNSARSSAAGLGSSQPLSSRKPSVLSMLFNRMVSSSQENVRRPGVKPNASTTSMRHQGRRQRGLMRSASRMSSTSQATCQSPESMARAPTIITQDSAIFRMSDVSLNTHGGEELMSPHQKSRKNSGDDDDPIVIKIKRRDKDGNVIVMESSEDLHYPPTRSGHLPRSRKPSRSIVPAESVVDDPSDSEEKRLISPEGRPSIPGTPSVFSDEPDGHEEEGGDHTLKKKRGLGSLNLKGLSKILASERHHHAESPFTPPQQRRRSYDSVADEQSQEDVHHHHQHSSKPDVSSPRNLSPIAPETDGSQTRSPYGGNIFVFPETAVPKASTPEGKFAVIKPESVKISTPDGKFPVIKPESVTPLISNVEQQALGKDPLETIEERPQECGSDESTVHMEEARKKLIPESELEVIPESDYMVTQTDSDDLMK